jgi:hypothetical protein
MSTFWGFIGGVATGFLGREIGAYFPTIAQWQINRAVCRVPEEYREASREKWFGIEAKLPGGLSKLLWGLACNWLLSRLSLPNTPENAAKILHFIYFLVFMKITLSNFIRLKFSSPKDLKAQWAFLKMFADQSLNVDKPDTPQPLLELADKVQDENIKRALTAAVETMRKAKADTQQQQ